MKYCQKKEKTKIYIAGKITGVANFKEIFAEAEKELKQRNYEVFNPANIELEHCDNCECSEGQIWAKYMLKCLPQLAQCDVICLLPNWRESEGARIEYLFAKRAGLKVCELIDGFLQNLIEEEQL